jgi:uncharacterized repeat protein (TIGR04042 family)
MPDLLFDVRWPDGEIATYYTPSSTLTEHLCAQTDYALDDFLTRARAALHHASERVRAKYGYYCSSALDTLQRIEAKARDARERGSTVSVLRIRDNGASG